MGYEELSSKQVQQNDATGLCGAANSGRVFHSMTLFLRKEVYMHAPFDAMNMQNIYRTRIVRTGMDDACICMDMMHT